MPSCSTVRFRELRVRRDHAQQGDRPTRRCQRTPGSRNDHAAILLAIHSGTNSADAINEFYGEPFSGEHRKALDHLRQWDLDVFPTLLNGYVISLT
jgi:hypothetical protein